MSGMVRFNTIKKFCELTGLSAAAVYTRKCKGVWPEGSVWRYEPGTKSIRMDLEAYDKWVEGEQGSPLLLSQATRLPSPTRVSGAASASRRSRLRPIFEK